MRVVIQRVSDASVTVNQDSIGEIGPGLLLLLGIEEVDTPADVEWLCHKIIHLRIFNDADGRMNLSITDIGGNFLVVSQFTLHANYKKGNRPSFIRAAKPETAIPLYELFLQRLKEMSGRKVASGIFGAMMKVSLVNDGPVTIMMDSRKED